MSEATSYPDFYTPTEELLPLDEAQRADATQVFNGLFDDLMLQDIDKVKRFESIKGKPSANLLKHMDVGGQIYSLRLEESSSDDATNKTDGVSFRDSELHARLISIQRIDKGYGREYWSYRLGADGVVRRWDGGDVTAKRRKDRELGIDEPKMLRGNETAAEAGRLIFAMIDGISNKIPNDRLEEDMGLNNQPVMADEIRGLQDFLARATDLP